MIIKFCMLEILCVYIVIRGYLWVRLTTVSCSLTSRSSSVIVDFDIVSWIQVVLYILSSPFSVGSSKAGEVLLGCSCLHQAYHQLVNVTFSICCRMSRWLSAVKFSVCFLLPPSTTVHTRIHSLCDVQWGSHHLLPLGPCTCGSMQYGNLGMFVYNVHMCF